MNPVAPANRRRSSRYPLHLKAQLAQPRNPRDPAPAPLGEAWTQDISGRGVYLEFSEPVVAGRSLVVTIDLPVHATLEPVTICLYCRVVRAMEEEGRRGVGAVIERYEFRRGQGAAGEPVTDGEAAPA